MKKYVVVEIFARRVVSISVCYTIEQACGRANEQLLDHISAIGAESTVANAGYKPTTDQWSFATEGTKRAWCNLCGYTWDAFIVEC